MIVVDKSSTCGVHNLNRFINYLSKIGGDQSPKPHFPAALHAPCMSSDLDVWAISRKSSRKRARGLRPAH